MLDDNGYQGQIDGTVMKSSDENKGYQGDWNIIHFFLSFMTIILINFSIVTPLFQFHRRKVGFSTINTMPPIRLKDDITVNSREDQTGTSIFNKPSQTYMQIRRFQTS